MLDKERGLEMLLLCPTSRPLLRLLRCSTSFSVGIRDEKKNGAGCSSPAPREEPCSKAPVPPACCSLIRARWCDNSSHRAGPTSSFVQSFDRLTRISAPEELAERFSGAIRWRIFVSAAPRSDSEARAQAPAGRFWARCSSHHQRPGPVDWRQRNSTTVVPSHRHGLWMTGLLALPFRSVFLRSDFDVLAGDHFQTLSLSQGLPCTSAAGGLTCRRGGIGCSSRFGLAALPS